MQDIETQLQEILKDAVAAYAEKLEQTAAEQAQAERLHEAYLQQHGGFVGDVLYYEKIKEA